MSRIFDALQRSESERSGVDLSVLSAAADVLQLAEHHAILERKGADHAERVDTPRAPERDSPPPVMGAAPVATIPESPLSSNDTQPDVFGQFESLPILVSPQSALVTLSDANSLAAEKFRFLGVRLQQLRREKTLKKLLITSTIPQEGKSMVAANLACTLARRPSQRTLLVEGDVRRPTLSQIFGLGRPKGICEWLQGERSLVTSVYHLEGPKLWILPAGSTTKNPLELLQAGRLSAMLDQLTALFDWIVIDSPPMLPLADTSVWMRLADGFLLVVRQGTTEKRQLQSGLEAIDSTKVIGAILNSSASAAHNNYYYTPPPS